MMDPDRSRRAGGTSPTSSRSLWLGALVVAASLTALPVGGQQTPPPNNLQYDVKPKILVDTGTDVGPNGLKLIDVNKDGKLDIIAVDRAADALWVLLGRGDGTFAVPTDPIDLNITPVALTIGDVSSPGGAPDGNPDIIVTDEDGGVAEIMLGDGAGGFSSDQAQDLSDIADGENAVVAAVIGDWDENGTPDLAVLDADDDDNTRVRFFCNSPDGNFLPCTTFEVVLTGQKGPVDMKAGDFDGDGHRDVVVLNQESHTFAVLYGYLNNQPGSFGNAQPRDARADAANGDNMPNALAVARLTGAGDTLDDMVIVNAETFSDLSTLVVLSQAQNRFQISPATGNTASSAIVAIGDVDNDGDLDAVIGSVGADGPTGPVVLLGDGAGGFNQTLISPGGALAMGDGLAITMGDLDGDSLIDLVQISADGDHISVGLNAIDQQRLNTPTPELTSTPTPPTVGSATITRTVTPTRPTSTATPTPTPTSIPTANYSACELMKIAGNAAADLKGITTGRFNSDTLVDIAVTDQANDKIWLIGNPGADLVTCAKRDSESERRPPTATPSMAPTSTPQFTPIASPTVTPSQSSGTVSQVGDTPIAIDSTPSPEVTESADMTPSPEDTATVQPTDTPTPTPTEIVVHPTEIDVPGLAPGTIRAVNLDGAKGDDLVVVGSDRVVVLWNRGDGTFDSPQTIVSFTDRPPAIVVDVPDPDSDGAGRAPLDLDGDGRPDIVVAVPNQNALRVFYGQGSHTFREPMSGSTPKTITIPRAATLLAAGDFDGGGLTDLVVATESEVLLLKQDRRESDGAHFVGQVPFVDDTATSLASGFFDGDRFADVLVTRASGDGGVAEVYTLTGGQNMVGSYPTDAAAKAAAVGLFNGDLNSDAVVASTGHGNNYLTFGIGNGTGALPGTLIPFDLKQQVPNAIAVGHIDDDMMDDVVTANADGSVTVLLSQAPRATPTPVNTSTPTLTPTPTNSPTAVPGTATNTPVSTATATIGTPKPGTFALSSCSINDDAGDGPLQVLALLAIIGLARSRRLRDRRRLIGGIAVLAVASATTSSPAHAQEQLHYAVCHVSKSVLGDNPGQLSGGAAGRLDDKIGDDLALLYDGASAIELVNADALRNGICPGVVTPSKVNVTNGRSLELVELTADRLTDLAYTELNLDVKTSKNNGAGSFSDRSSNTIPQAGPVAAADLDGDGIVDLVVGNGATIAILRGSNPATYAVAGSGLLLDTQTPSAISRVRIGDVNGDGRKDIVAIDQNGSFGVFVQGTGTFPDFTLAAALTLSAPEDIRLGEFDSQLVASGQNPVLDVAYVNSNGLHVLLGSVVGSTLSFNPIDVSNESLKALAVGDADGDGFDDIVVADATHHTIAVFIGNGGGQFTPAMLDHNDTVGTTPNGVILGDLDGDTRLDIVTTNRGDGSVTIFLSTNPEPTPTATASDTPTITPTPDTPSPSPTATLTITLTPSITPTPTTTVTVTVTTTFGGFQVQGNCAVANPTGLSDAMPLLVLAALVLIRWRAKA